MKNFIALPIAATALVCSTTIPAVADTVLATNNGIIEPSLCVGFDCTNPETYGDNTIRMKENNTRIQFVDTSAAPFPTNDWRIVANNSSNGGDSYLAFHDETGRRFPFVVRAGARANALYVDPQGEVGIGTSNPVVEIHAVRGDTPALRLEQDASSGFQPQTWDVAGNETSFFIRDVSNGSTLPFRIRPGAASNSLIIDGDDNVGIGTLSPDGKLHTFGPGVQFVYFESSDNDAVQVRMRTDSGNRRFVALDGDNNVETQIVFNNDRIELAGPTSAGANLWAVIDANGITTKGPDCGTPCDAVFDKDAFTVPPIEERAAYMWGNKHLPAVGPTGPGLPFNVTEKTAGMLHELEIAHIYIAQQQEVIKAMQGDIDGLTSRLTVLESH